MNENKRLYVGNLPWSVRREDLSELFAQAGTVVDAYIVLDREKHRSKGYGFVEFDTVEAATKAVEMFNDYELEGRKLVVNFAHPKTGGEEGNQAPQETMATDNTLMADEEEVAVSDDTEMAAEETDEEVLATSDETEMDVEAEEVAAEESTDETVA